MFCSNKNKKNSERRMSVNFRRLNGIKIRTCYPFSSIDD